MVEISKLLRVYYTFRDRKMRFEIMLFNLNNFFLFFLFWVKTRSENKILRPIILCMVSTLDQR